MVSRLHLAFSSFLCRAVGLSSFSLRGVGGAPVPAPTEKAAQSLCQLLFHTSSISQLSQELL